jgi:hypothetical protein
MIGKILDPASHFSQFGRLRLSLVAQHSHVASHVVLQKRAFDFCVRVADALASKSPCHSVRKLQFTLNRLEARLFAQRIQERVGRQHC